MAQQILGKRYVDLTDYDLDLTETITNTYFDFILKRGEAISLNNSFYELTEAFTDSSFGHGTDRAVRWEKKRTTVFVKKKKCSHLVRVRTFLCC